MTLDEIKARASSLPLLDEAGLNREVAALRQSGVAYLPCLCFVSVNQQVDLATAHRLTLALDAFSAEEKALIEGARQVMLAEMNETE